MITEILFLVDYQDMFSIVDDTGELHVGRNLDCCDVLFQLTVVAKDQGVPPLSDKVEIEIIPYSSSHPPHPHTGKTFIEGERDTKRKEGRQEEKEGMKE